MKRRHDSFRIVLDPKKRTSLEPFLTVLDSVMYLLASEHPPEFEPGWLSNLDQEIDRLIREGLGQPLDRAITLFGLKVCCHNYWLSASERDQPISTEAERFLSEIDRTYRWLSALAVEHGVSDLYVLLLG